MPRVTVIIPTYNWSSVLPFSIKSVQRQSFTDLELLVIGDGCTDDSAQVVAKYADARTRWINLPTNFGQQSAPNNHGLEIAQGDVIAYLGHDDLWLPHHLQTLLAAIDAGADMAYGMTELVAPGNQDPRSAPPAGTYRPGIWVPPTGTVHRRDIVQKLGGWRDYRQIDVDPEADLWKRIWAGGGKIEFVPRLTAVKFPAAMRKNVYKTRSCFEQSLWFDRIGAEPDFELTELTRLAVTGQKQFDHQSYGKLCSNLFNESRQRLWNVFFAKKGGTIRARRKFKGLDRAPS